MFLTAANSAVRVRKKRTNYKVAGALQESSRSEESRFQVIKERRPDSISLSRGSRAQGSVSTGTGGL